MSYHNLNNAVLGVKRDLNRKTFNAFDLIKNLIYGNEIGFENLRQVGVDLDYFNTQDYNLKDKLGNEIKNNIEFYELHLDIDLISAINVSDLTSKDNLSMAIASYIKQKIKDIVYDIDNDDLVFIKNKIQKLIENEECDNE